MTPVRSLQKRALWLFVLLALGVLIPWWAMLALVCASTIFFRSFYEVALVGLEMDVLYGSSLERGLPFLFTAITLILALLVPLLKKKFSFSDRFNY